MKRKKQAGRDINNENSHISDISRYCDDIAKGRIPSCEFVKLACKRHTDDLKRQKDSDFPYYFDESAVVRFLDFAGSMQHVTGEWRGQLIKAEPWQKFVFGVPFGWKKKKDHFRRYREIYAEIARKNAKSTWGAIVSNYMLVADGEGAPQIYSGATSEKQAHFVFDPAWLMFNNDTELRGYFSINLTGSVDNPTGIFCRKNGGKFIAIIGNPGDGAGCSCAVIDEYHEHQTAALFKTMRTGMGARRQPLMVVVTTAGENTSYPCYVKREHAISVLRGIKKDDRSWCVIYTIDESDNWEDYNCWVKANPNLGVSVFDDFLRGQYDAAIASAGEQNNIKCKHLNVWTNAGTAWLNMAKVKVCGESLEISDFEGEECALSLDLASTLDICAYTKTFLRGDKYYSFSRYYLPSETVELIENEHYQRWRDEGLITVTQGAMTDYDFILEDIKTDLKKYQARAFAYDSYNALHLMQCVQRELPKLVLIDTPMSPKNISPPMKELEGLIYSKRYAYDEKDKVLYWMMGNAMLRNDAAKNYFLARQNKKSKIDGVMTCILGVMVWKTEIEQSVASIYEQRGMRML